MLGEVVVIQQAVISGAGEDCYAVAGEPQQMMLCVADGCGGLGSKRYEQKNNATGAYIASRLAVKTMEEWLAARGALSGDAGAAQLELEGLQFQLDTAFQGCALELCSEEAPSRIVGSMQRVLPTTLCTLMINKDRCAFLWAGDSRGYTLDAHGLHQYTRDDVRGNPDAFEGLLLDRPLNNLISADRAVRLHGCGFAKPEKGLLLCATDGVYGAVSSPMALEMLLLDTLVHAFDADSWQRRLDRRLSSHMQDDITLLCCPSGFESFREMQRYFLPRYESLKNEYIKPIQRSAGDRDAERALWQRYRIGYDRTEGIADERQDWRV